MAEIEPQAARVKPVKENPLKYRHVRLFRLFCYPFGIWPGDMLDEKMPGCYRYYIKQCPVQATIVFVGEIIYLVGRWDTLDFFTVGDVLITTFLTVVSFVRMILTNMQYYGIIWRRFLKDFHLGNFKEAGINFNKVANKMNTISHYFTLVTIAAIFCGLILFNLSPFCANVASGAFKNPRPQNMTLRFSISYEYPGFRPEDHFVFITILNLYLSYASTIFICAIDLLLILMIFQIIGHMEVLRLNLDDFPTPKNVFTKETVVKMRQIIYSVERFTEEENVGIHYRLVDCIHHHRYIVSFVDEMSQFFGPMIGLIYLYQLVGCCLLLLECSQLDSQALARYGPLTVISVLQLIEISVIFEIVGLMSERLIDNVYNLPWQCMDMKNKKTVYIFFNRIQRTIHVTCMGMAEVGVQSMAAILKTSFSYFTFLKTIEA